MTIKVETHHVNRVIDEYRRNTRPVCLTIVSDGPRLKNDSSISAFKDWDLSDTILCNPLGGAVGCAHGNAFSDIDLQVVVFCPR